MPEARVFRPRSEKENQLIDALMKTHSLQGDIQKASWTSYVTWLINQDLHQVRNTHRERTRV